MSCEACGNKDFYALCPCCKGKGIIWAAKQALHEEQSRTGQHVALCEYELAVSWSRSISPQAASDHNDGDPCSDPLPLPEDCNLNKEPVSTMKNKTTSINEPTGNPFIDKALGGK